MALGPPLNVYSRNVGNGSMEVRWAAPASGTPDYYDVYAGLVSGGSFEQVNDAPVEDTMFRVVNLPEGERVYSKVVAVDEDGDEGAFSALALDATVGRAGGQLLFQGPIGDEIVEGAIFAAVVHNELIALRVLSGGTITG